MVGRCFYQLSLARESFEFNKYVELSSASDNESYNDFLVFLNNLRKSSHIITNH